MVFDLSEEEKDGERMWKIKSPDDIRQALEDNILSLQSIAASKYARAFKKKLKQWETDLNTMNEVIDVWLLVQ